MSLMENNRNSYGSILKATSLFGGVKVFEILIAIVRTKFVALLLGPSGMGVYGLIASPVNLIKHVTGFGLGTSGVREISKSFAENNTYKKNYIVTILRKLVWLTGTLGLLVTFFLAGMLSQLSFGNSDYTIWFRLVSITLLLDQIVVGQRVLMQGTFHYTFLAKSAIIGNFVGLIVTIPIYYFFGIKGVVPVFLLHSLTTLFLSWYFARKIEYQSINLSTKEVLAGGSTMIGLGLAIAMTGAVTLGTEYVLRLFISNTGNVADVGLFNAGIAIATQYIGVVLTSMSSDYIPRVSAVSGNNIQFAELINRQMQLLMVIIGPLVGIFILFIKEVVLILYSSKFIPITGMIEWIMFGMFFRSISFCLSYAVVAKADSKRFFWNELFTASYSLLFYLIGYHYYRFEGMGIAYCLTYVIYSLQMFFFCRIRYGFHFEAKTLRIVTLQMIVTIVLLFLTKMLHYSIFRYVFGCIWLSLIFVLAYKDLSRMLNVRESIKSIKNKLFNKYATKKD